MTTEDTKNELCIALVQASTILGDIDANINSIERLLNNVSGVDLIILPEMFSTGFSMKPEIYAETVDGKALKYLQKKAQQTNSAILASIMIDDGGVFYNRAFFVFPNGEYQHYNKRHLFSYGGEDKKYQAGTERLIVEYRGWRICPLVCYDLRFPVWSRNRSDYDLLVYAASWPNARQNVWSTLPLARAIENQCYVATVNRVGEDKTGAYSGESKIVNALGEVISKSTLNQECVAVGKISLSDLMEIRRNFPFAKDADEFDICSQQK